MPDTTNNTTFKEVVKKYLPQNSNRTIPYGVGCAWLGRDYENRAQVKEDLLTLETAYQTFSQG